MLIPIIGALAVYTCMVVSNKLRKPVAIIGTIIMFAYCIVGNIVPMEKIFLKYPVKLAILLLIPCVVYAIGLAVYTPIKMYKTRHRKLHH